MTLILAWISWCTSLVQIGGADRRVRVAESMSRSVCVFQCQRYRTVNVNVIAEWISKSSFKVNVNAESMSMSWCVACAMSSSVSSAKSKLRDMFDTCHELCHMLHTSSVQHGDTLYSEMRLIYKLSHVESQCCVQRRTHSTLSLVRRAESCDMCLIYKLESQCCVQRRIHSTTTLTLRCLMWSMFCRE